MYIFYDIGGTSTRIGLSSDKVALGEHIMFNTLPDFVEGFALLLEKTHELLDGQMPAGISVGLPGTLNPEKSTLVHAPHLLGWQGFDIKGALANEFLCEVVIENDTAMVGLGEAVYGAGAGNNIVAYITLSTGVGGVKIENSQIDANSIGFEIGHHYLDGTKTFEQMVSGTAIEAKYKTKPKEILDEHVWQQYTDDVARGIANVITFWSPDIVVIGGSMSRSVLFDQLNKKTKELCPEYDAIPQIVVSKLDTIGGLYGGLATFSKK